MTGAEACEAIFKGVNALFAEWAVVDESERTAYVERLVGDSCERFVFVTFASGAPKEQLEPRQWRTDLDDEVLNAIAAVAATFPEHAAQRVLWRTEPVFDENGPTPAAPKYRIEAQPARSGTYFRCVAMPVEAVAVGTLADINGRLA